METGVRVLLFKKGEKTLFILAENGKTSNFV